MSTITLATMSGDVTVPGEVCGPFAVHAPLTGDVITLPWTVTHLATGLRISVDFPTKAAALGFAHALLPLRNVWDSPIIDLTEHEREVILAIAAKWGGVRRAPDAEHLRAARAHMASLPVAMNGRGEAAP